jgi:hypothetical protein
VYFAEAFRDLVGGDRIGAKSAGITYSRVDFVRIEINPTSFSQTTENLFYFSFLVREQKAAVEVDEDPDIG